MSRLSVFDIFISPHEPGILEAQHLNTEHCPSWIAIMHKPAAAGPQFASVLQFTCPSPSPALSPVNMEFHQFPKVILFSLIWKSGFQHLQNLPVTENPGSHESKYCYKLRTGISVFLARSACRTDTNSLLVFTRTEAGVLCLYQLCTAQTL